MPKYDFTIQDYIDSGKSLTIQEILSIEVNHNNLLIHTESPDSQTRKKRFSR